jgi:hypothetical protein
MGKPGGKRPLGRHRRRSEDNIKVLGRINPLLSIHDILNI